MGAALKAADANNDILTHTLTGDGAMASFKIDPATGQITVGADTIINFEGDDNDEEGHGRIHRRCCSD